VNASAAGLSHPGEEARHATVAVTDLFREHHLELVRLALVMVGDQETAEDVVQDAFERLYHGWNRLREPSSALAYARSSVINGCRSAMRRSAVARKHAPKLAGISGTGAAGTGPADDDHADLADALLLLPRRQREVLVLRYYADLDVAEVAATLRIAPSAVRSTCTRGLAALARVLGEDRG
jgi:RNA polymerase sigma-70 factor (sigma-E family)